MKNNKGVTLIELIVAFAIVAVATVYFFQTVSLVKKMYANAREETNSYTDKTYAIRMLDSCIDVNNTSSTSDLLTECNISGVGKISRMDFISDKIYNVLIEDINGNRSSFFKYYNQLPSSSQDISFSLASDVQSKYTIDGVEVDAVKTGYVNGNGNRSYFNNYDSGSKFGGYNCNYYWGGVWDNGAKCVLSSQDHVIGASRKNSEGYVRVKVPQRGRIYVKVGYDVDCAEANNSEIQVFFTDKNGNKITSAGNLSRTFSWYEEVPRNADRTVNSTAEWKNIADITSNVKVDKDSYIYIFLKHGEAGEECSAYGYVKQISIIN